MGSREQTHDPIMDIRLAQRLIEPSHEFQEDDRDLG